MKGDCILETMSAFLGNIGTLFTEILTWSTSLVTTILNNPALTVMTFGLVICGAVFGYTSRLIHGR